MHPNLSLLAKDGAVLGTIERDWRVDELTNHPLHGVSVVKESPTVQPGAVPNNCECLLGDFKHFGDFLAQQLNSTDGEVKTDAA